MSACEQCNRPVSEKVADYSSNKFKRVLCYDCQQENRVEKPKYSFGVSQPKPTGRSPADWAAKDAMVEKNMDIKLAHDYAQFRLKMALEMGDKGNIDYEELFRHSFTLVRRLNEEARKQ